MTDKQPDTYSSILQTEDIILFSSMNSSDFQEFTNKIYSYFEADLIITDPLHFILAMSPRLSQSVENFLNWGDFIRKGLVPPLQSGNTAKFQPDNFSGSFSEQLSENIIIHHNVKTLSGRRCILCDIMHQGDVIVRLILSSPKSFHKQQMRLLLPLISAVNLLYFRLSDTSKIMFNSRLLLRLLYSDSKGEQTEQSLPHQEQGETFQLILIEHEKVKTHTISFSEIFENMEQPRTLLSAADNGFYIVLIKKGRNSYDLLHRLDILGKEYSFPILISEAFEDLCQMESVYRTQQQLAGSLKLLESPAGLILSSQLMLFPIFENLKNSPLKETFLLHEAQVLAEKDKNGQSSLAQTLYCWLFCDKEPLSTTKAMGIHRNTLDKRLHKVFACIKGNWRSSSYCFRMLFSLYCILQSQRKIYYISAPMLP